ncbi:MAG: polyprenyl synthetase family protein [Bacteroidales bacterium]|nr:polyprenyl synthetase family protein [Bacteroidales bacterium]
MYTLEQLEKEAIALIEQESFLNEPSTLYDPIEYGMKQGGKRIRPLLTLIAADMFSQDIEKAKSAAIAVEILHNFTLLHDDIMDQSPLRRGKETVYKKFNSNKAILSGDTMFALAFKHLLNYENEIVKDLVEILTQSSIEVCEGQAFDMEFETRNDVKIEEYIKMIRLKTGVLLSCALRLGATTAHCTKENLSLLDEFAQNIGIAFQIQDDILDCWSDLEVFGKITGKDIVDNKKTFLYLKALEIGSERQQNILKELYSSKNFESTQKEQVVKSIYEELKIKELAQKEMQYYHNLALESLDKIKIDNERKENLRLFAEKLMKRNK